MYPFEKADIAFEKLPAYKKAKYLEEVSTWVSSSAYRLESQEIIRKYYQDLAIKPLDEITMTGYRLAILMEQDRQKRLIKKQEEYFEIVELSD